MRARRRSPRIAALAMGAAAIAAITSGGCRQEPVPVIVVRFAPEDLGARAAANMGDSGGARDGGAPAAARR